MLDASGQGYISNVIAAIDYAIANKDALHLRVINLSVAAGVYESYTTDPLTLAAKRAVEAGLVVVSAAGNLGRGRRRQTAVRRHRRAGQRAVGHHRRRVEPQRHRRSHPTTRSPASARAVRPRIDFQAKPDLVAPGVGIESLAEAGSTLWNTKPLMRLWGTVPTAHEPYLSLSGTSMASPVVSGTIALMLQANPALTPNLVKAILQYTAESHDELDALTQGAGFLNARGAVELRAIARAAAPASQPPRRNAIPTRWSAHIIWGNHRIAGGKLRADANAWRTDVMWGSDAGARRHGGHARHAVRRRPRRDHVRPVCMEACRRRQRRRRVGHARGVWARRVDRPATDAADNIVWGTNAPGRADNIVWGTPAIRRASRSW